MNILKCTKGYIRSLYVHYLYVLIYEQSAICLFIFFNIKYEHSITLRLQYIKTTLMLSLCLL